MALQTSVNKMAGYREGLRRRLDRPLTAEEEQALEIARGEARLIAEQLVKQHGAKRVILFGSVAQRRRLRQNSDVDLAAEGMPADSFYGIVGDLRTETGRTVDLIRLETARESLKKAIRLEGIELAHDGT